MNFAFQFDYTNDFVEGLIFIVAAVYVLLSIGRARRTNQAAHLKWLMPLAIYTVEEAVTYAITNVYTLTGVAEPHWLGIIIDIMDDVTLIAFLWALIVLWRILRSTPELLKTPWLDGGETPEGVWPPAPKA